jgi:hypothetical protein
VFPEFSCVEITLLVVGARGVEFPYIDFGLFVEQIGRGSDVCTVTESP